jgi:hypothetical protein
MKKLSIFSWSQTINAAINRVLRDLDMVSFFDLLRDFWFYITECVNEKSPPNGLNCSLQVSYGVEELIFLALAVFLLNPLPLRFLRFFDLLEFTIWVPPVIIVEGCHLPL